MATQGAVVPVDGQGKEEVGAVAAQAEVAAGQQQHSLSAVLADDAFLQVLLLLEKGQQAVHRLTSAVSR